MELHLTYRRMGQRGVEGPTAFDCFAGCGGMTEGLKQAGFNVVGAIENDEKACDVYCLNHPGVRVWREDVRVVSAAQILSALKLKPGGLDLLGGCPPCQGFSTLRTYNGKRYVRDEQNDLIFEFERLVIGLNPKLVMMENVPGLFRDNRFSKFKAALEQVGYSIKADVLNVADYGVPQRRHRLVMLASRVGPVEFGTIIERRRTVRDAIGHLPKAGKSGDPLHDFAECHSSHVREIIASVPHDGGSRSSIPDHLVLKCHRSVNGFKDVYGRMAWDAPSPTITTGCFNPSKGRYLHPVANRAITMREAALFQSFPPNYKFSPKLGKVRIAKMIGNALPPRFIRVHAERLKATPHLGSEPQ